MVDGDENEPKRHLPQYQPGVGALFVRDVRVRHAKKTQV
jgi:hypothetical protein